MNTCTWCKNEITSGDEVWIERMIPNQPEYDGVFCGDEHASLWVAKPFDPDPEAPAETWQDKVHFAGCLLALALIGVFAVIGAVASSRWFSGAF